MRPGGRSFRPPGGRWVALLGALLALAPWLRPPPATAQSQGADSLTLTVRPIMDTPPAPVTDLNATPGLEGQVLLEWTAPDGNHPVPTGQLVASYEIRLATFSAASVGSTTTWWNAAASTSPSLTIQPPGGLQSLLLDGLEPGATLWFAIKSMDASLFTSEVDTKTASPANQAFALVFDAVPPAPIGLTTTTVQATSIGLSWTIPPAPDLDFYRLYVDSTSPYDFADSYVLVIDSSQASYLHTGLRPLATYFYRMTAVDKGTPAFNGHPLESPFSDTVSTRTLAGPRPMAPLALRYQAGGASLAWHPVRRFVDGVLFTDPANPTPDELAGYRVFRATHAYLAPWTDVSGLLSTGTASWAAAPSSDYYYVQSENPAGASRSWIWQVDPPTLWLVSYDQRTHMQIPEACLEGLIGPDEATSYLIAMASQTATAQGIFKHLSFTAMRAGVEEVDDWALKCFGKLRIRYEGTTGGALLPSGVAPQPRNLSVFWHNGQRWVQLFGQLDDGAQTMTVETKFFGDYQLRTTERVGAFNFDPATLTNRFITPNGDGKNDSAVFIFDAPPGVGVSGKIFDLSGAEVATMTQGPMANSLMWDGKAGGQAVPGGVYLYQLEAEGRRFNGTIVVIK